MAALGGVGLMSYALYAEHRAVGRFTASKCYSDSFQRDLELKLIPPPATSFQGAIGGLAAAALAAYGTATVIGKALPPISQSAQQALQKPPAQWSIVDAAKVLWPRIVRAAGGFAVGVAVHSATKAYLDYQALGEQRHGVRGTGVRE